MRLNKKLASALAALMMLSSVSAFAKYDASSNTYTFNYKPQISEDMPINVICLKEGVKPTDITESNFGDLVIFADNMKIDAGKEGTLTFGMPSSAVEGTYSIWVFAGDMKTPATEYEKFYYPASTGLSTMLGKFNADGADYTALIAEYTKDDKLMLANIDPNDEYYKANSTGVNTLLAGHRQFTSVASIEKAYNDAVVTHKLNTADKDSIGDAVASMLAFSGKKETASYTENKTDVLDAYLTSKTQYTKASEALGEFNEISVITLFNGTDDGDKIKGFVSDYADYLGVSYSDYIGCNTSIVNTYLINKGFTSSTAIKTAIVNGIAAAKANDNSGSQGSSSSGSSSKRGSSSSGGSFTVAPSVGQNTTSGAFSDMASVAWAQEAVNSLAEKGIVSGDGNGLFRPNDSVTREEFLKMLVTAFGFEASADAVPFEDVPQDAWYAPYVSAAYKLGITSGKSETVFGTGDNITREEMAALISRVFAVLGKNIGSGDGADFTDEASISAYAVDAVKALQSVGIITGMEDGSFRPTDLSTRAQAAVVIYRAMSRL